MTTVREATLDDLETLAQFAAEFVALTPYGRFMHTETAMTAAFITAVLEHPQTVVLLADVDGVAAGMIAGLAGANMTGEMWCEELAWWVPPSFRSSRAGPYLLGSLKVWARQRGCVCLKMIAPAGSAVGEFYERCGFVLLETSYVLRL